MADKQIERFHGRCARTDEPLAEGEVFYTVLYEDGDSFRREDYCEKAWDGPPESAYCWFRSRVPIRDEKPKKRVFVDDNLLIEFFKRLADDDQLVRQQFRFVLALILMRKRLLRYEQTVIEGEKEIWQMRFPKDAKLHGVLNPRLQDDEIETVSQQLGQVLHADMGEFGGETTESDVGSEESDSPAEMEVARDE